MFVEFDLKQLKLAFYLLTSIHFNSLWSAVSPSGIRPAQLVTRPRCTLVRQLEKSDVRRESCQSTFGSTSPC